MDGCIVDFRCFKSYNRFKLFIYFDEYNVCKKRLKFKMVMIKKKFL